MITGGQLKKHEVEMKANKRTCWNVNVAGIQQGPLFNKSLCNKDAIQWTLTTGLFPHLKFIIPKRTENKKDFCKYISDE